MKKQSESFHRNVHTKNRVLIFVFLKTVDFYLFVKITYFNHNLIVSEFFAGEENFAGVKCVRL